MSEVELLLTIAYLFVVGAFLINDILWLRIIYFISCAIALIAGIYGDLLSMVIWQGIIGAINIIYIIKLILNKYPVALQSPLKIIYDKKFTYLTTREFKELYKYAKPTTKNRGCYIYKEHTNNNSIFLIISGSAMVAKNFNNIAELKAGDFIGEMSVITGKNTAADVIVKEDMECLIWSGKMLDKLKTKKPHLYTGIMTAVGIDLAYKIETLSVVFSES